MDPCACRTESLGCSSETTTTLLIGCTPIQNKKVKKRKKKSVVFTSQGDIGEFTGSPSKEDPDSIRNPSDRPAAAWPGWDLQVRTTAQNRSVGVPPASTWFSPRDTFGGGACEPRRRHRSLSSFLGSLAPLANHMSYLISPSVDLLFC